MMPPFTGLKKANLPRLGGSDTFTLHTRIAAIAILGLFILIHGKGMAGETTLLSIGPRYGFSGKSPLLGKQQTYNFDLFDVTATFRLPWSWPLGESLWSLETRLITSAGALYGAGDGLGFFGRDKYGTQDFGGHVQIVGTTGLQIHPIPHAFAGFRLQHFSDAGLYGSDALGVDLYIVELGYRF